MAEWYTLGLSLQSGEMSESGRGRSKTCGRKAVSLEPLACSRGGSATALRLAREIYHQINIVRWFLVSGYQKLFTINLLVYNIQL